MFRCVDLQYSVVCLREAASQAERLLEEEEEFVHEVISLLEDPWKLALPGEPVEPHLNTRTSRQETAASSLEQAWTWLDGGAVGGRTRSAWSRVNKLLKKPVDSRSSSAPTDAEASPTTIPSEINPVVTTQARLTKR
jgi:hypothetical protein